MAAASTARAKSGGSSNAPIPPLKNEFLVGNATAAWPASLYLLARAEAMVASGFQRGATTMTTHTANGSTDKLPTAVEECVPALLTEAELKTIAAGGGGAGINPSRTGGGTGINPSRS